MRATRIALGLGTALLLAVLRPIEVDRSAERVRVLDRHGSVLFGPQHQARVSAQSLAPHVAPALIAVEDRRFNAHPGVDPLAVVRAAISNVRSGEVVSGASTLSMQVARMLRNRRDRGPADKLAEMLLALRLELWHSKTEILELWLERAYFGRAAYGIGPAAAAWFGKTPADLSLAEAAFLVGLPQRPARGLDGLKRRQEVVLAAMVALGVATPQQATDAFAQTLRFSQVDRPGILAAHASISLAQGTDREVVTTIDAALQAEIERLARGHTASLTEERVGNVATVVLENSTGAILAYLGSADYFDLQREGANDGVRMLRQPGSALKPFVYGAAFDAGIIGAETILLDVETPFVEAGAAFSAENYDRLYHGPVPARRALASSYNVPAVTLVDRLGPQKALGTLRRAGFESLRRNAEHYGVGLALGNGEVSLLELARAYAGLARGGSFPDVHVVRGRPLLSPISGALPPDVAFLLLDILSDPEARAPAFGRGGPLETSFPMAAKTGTSKDYGDNWAIGVTPEHTIAVWAGNFDGSPMQGVSGVSGAGTLLRAIAEVVGGSGTFEIPPGVSRALRCRDTGLPVHDGCSLAVEEWVLDRHAPPESETIVEPLPSQEYPNIVTVSAPTLAVRYPADGMVFQIDPVLRPEYQRVGLQADVPPGWTDLQFLVNGEPHEGRLLLDPTLRTVQVTALDPQGVRRRSRTATITVLPTPVPTQ